MTLTSHPRFMPQKSTPTQRKSASSPNSIKAQLMTPLSPHGLIHPLIRTHTSSSTTLVNPTYLISFANAASLQHTTALSCSSSGTPSPAPQFINVPNSQTRHQQPPDHPPPTAHCSSTLHPLSYHMAQSTDGKTTHPPTLKKRTQSKHNLLTFSPITLHEVIPTQPHSTPASTCSQPPNNSRA